MHNSTSNMGMKTQMFVHRLWIHSDQKLIYLFTNFPATFFFAFRLLFRIFPPIFMWIPFFSFSVVLVNMNIRAYGVNHMTVIFQYRNFFCQRMSNGGNVYININIKVRQRRSFGYVQSYLLAGRCFSHRINFIPLDVFRWIRNVHVHDNQNAMSSPLIFFTVYKPQAPFRQVFDVSLCSHLRFTF